MNQKTAIDFFSSDQAFFITKLLKQHWNKERYDYRISPRPDHGLMLVIRGEIKLLWEGSVLTAKAGDIVFLPKQSHYEAIFEREAEDYLVNFDGKGAHPSFSFPIRLLQNAPLSCSESFHGLIEEKLSGTQSPLRLKGLFYLLLDSIASGVSAESSWEQKTFETAKLLLCREEIKIGEIAHRCGISESGFRKKFKEITGSSPTEYRLSFKLEKAKHLLEGTDRNISQIADQLHFYDAAHFCKIFRAHTGMTPLGFSKRKQL